MRIKKATIYGFGKWVDTEWTFPQNGPLIFYGENESGKTTLHQFILFILFGLAPRERKFNQPKTSSKMGGRLLIDLANVGEVTIERLAEKNQGRATCFLPDGVEQDEQWLQAQFDGLDKQTYEAIFSFSSVDLSAIMSMKEEDLAEILLGIGLTGSNNIYQIEKQLDTDIAELFKPLGKVPLINKQLVRLDKLSSELEGNKQKILDYRKQTEKIVNVSSELAELEEQIKQGETERNELIKLQTAFPIIQEHQALLLKQNESQVNRPFPNHGVGRLETVNEKLRPLESNYAVLQNQKERVQAKIANLDEEIIKEKVYDELNEVKLELDSLVKLEKEITVLEGEVRANVEHVAHEANALEIDQAVVSLEEIILPFYVEETWKQLKSEQEAVALTEASLLTEERSFQEEVAYTEQQATLLEKELLPDEKIADMIKKRDASKEFEQHQKWQAENKEKNKRLDEQHKKELRKATIFFTSSILLGLIGFIIGFMLEENTFYLIGIFLFLIGIGQWLFFKQNWKRLSQFVQAPKTYEKPPAVSEIELQEIEQVLAAQEKINSQLSIIAGEIKKQQIVQIKLAEKKRIFHERKSRLEEQISVQKELYPFLETIDLVYWPEYFLRLERLLTLNEKRHELTAKLATVRDEFEEKERVIQLFINKHKPELMTMEKNALLSELTTMIRNQELAVERLKEEEEELAKLLKNIQDQEKSMQVFHDEKAELFKIAEVSDEEEFYQIDRELSEQKALKHAFEENKQQLEAIFPNKTWKKWLEQPIGKMELEQKLAETENSLKNNKQLQAEQRDELSKLTAIRNQLESEEHYSERIHHFEMEKASLEQLGAEWATLKIEKEVLRETKQQYKEKYLTRVMEETTRFFAIITAGKYIQVYAPDEKETFFVESEQGMRYSVNELSQGTMQQLYVALRLAINQVMAEKHRLPFILDDAFVHFDSPRTERMMHVLGEIAKTQQVIFFTCKQDILNFSQILQYQVLEL